VRFTAARIPRGAANGGLASDPESSDGHFCHEIVMHHIDYRAIDLASKQN
jgi:hypothetical protein